MRPNIKILFGAICFCLLLPKFAVAAETSNPRELLARYVVELQTAPEDQPLRERIIRLERTMMPSPAVPEEAKRFFVRATIFQQEASDIRGREPLAMSAYAFAISSYKEALLIAPWWPEAYYGLSTSLQGAGRYDDAVAALNLYMATGPNAAGASAAADRLCAIAARAQSDRALSKR
ncbi:MAG TPA: tetratricopeptide repeat protein [Thermoanaerobaculia bacterium]|nr:tetratricopeptide repeat protein [Thermoanaerobaculia bacterium]